MYNTLTNGVLTLELSISVNNCYYYHIYKDDILIGNCGIRLNQSLENDYIGNIEYEVFPMYRGNNYAYEATKILSKIALDNNVDKLLITAKPNNKASIKTIEKLNVKFLKVRRVPLMYHPIKIGRYVRVYEWDLKKEGIENVRH